MADELIRLGHYEIIRPLGQGSMGTVYLAIDQRTSRQVALKVLAPSRLRDPQANSRIHLQSLPLMLLEHPNIMPVYEVGEIDDQHYIVMPYYEQGSLKRHLAYNGPMAYTDVVRIIDQIAGALDYGHARGDVHGGISPSNIFVTDVGHAVLADYGLTEPVESLVIARSVQDGDVETLAYIAPEVHEQNYATESSDIYALACVCYEMLTGKALFARANPRVTVLAHTRQLMFTQDWPDTMPDDLVDVLDMALDSDPTSRFSSAGVFARALHSLVPERADDLHIQVEPERPVVQPVTRPQPSDREGLTISPVPEPPVTSKVPPDPLHATLDEIETRADPNTSFEADASARSEVVPETEAVRSEPVQFDAFESPVDEQTAFRNEPSPLEPGGSQAPPPSIPPKPAKRKTLYVILAVVGGLLLLTCSVIGIRWIGTYLEEFAVAGNEPTRTFTPTYTPAPTDTPAPSATPSRTPFPTYTRTNTPTKTPAPTTPPPPTSTPEPTSTPRPPNTPVPTNPPLPTSTPIPLPTATPILPLDAHVTIINGLSVGVHIVLEGPYSLIYELSAGETRVVHVPIGYYDYTVSAAGYYPLTGSQDWAAGEWEWSFYDD